MKLNEPCNENTQGNYKFVAFLHCWWKVRLQKYTTFIHMINLEDEKTWESFD